MNDARSRASGSRSTSRSVLIGCGGQATGPSSVTPGNLSKETGSRPRGQATGHPTCGSVLVRGGRVDAEDSLVAVLVGDHGERGRVTVIDDGATRGDGSSDPLLGRLGRHVDLEVEPLTRGRR